MYKSLNPGLVGIETQGFEQTLALAKRHGFGAIGYSPEAIESEGIDTFRALDLMGRYGVIISDFGLPVQIRNKEVFNESFPKLEKAAKAAAKLGIRRCCTWMMSSSQVYEYAENFRFHTKMLRLIAETLGEYDIHFGVEFLGPKDARIAFQYPFIHTLDKMLELCDAVGTDNIGVMLDAHHCYCSGLRGAEFAKYIRSEKDIVLVHLNDDAPGVPLDEINDSPRYYPGEPGGGGNDLHSFMKALQDLDYTGPVVAEPNSEGLKGLENDEIAKIIFESTSSVWPNQILLKEGKDIYEH